VDFDPEAWLEAEAAERCDRAWGRLYGSDEAFGAEPETPEWAPDPLDLPEPDWDARAELADERADWGF
jgi:hypothetical protein